jgi:hypothetical protein
MQISRVWILTVLSLSLGAAAACSNKAELDKPDAAQSDGGPGPEYRIATEPNLQWKRYGALEADLARALALPPEELCREFGRESCIREVHLVPLGGNDPFKTGLLEPSAEPLATTPTAIDRILLSACSKRVELDRAAAPGGAMVFGALDLAAAAPDPSEAPVVDTVTTLYRRLLARDPDEHELQLVAALARDKAGQPVSATDFATLSCFAIGTTTEFLFF